MQTVMNVRIVPANFPYFAGLNRRAETGAAEPMGRWVNAMAIAVNQATRRSETVAARIGTWEVVRQVGEGSFTRVFLVRPDERHTPAHVLKVLRPEHEDNVLAIALLRREAAIGQRLAHPHLATVLSAHLKKSPYYIVMPYLEGAALNRVLARHGQLAVRSAVWIARQVAQGLAALHAAGWLHNDVKPANVIVSPRGHATLVDLGFARRPAEVRRALGDWRSETKDRRSETGERQSDMRASAADAESGSLPSAFRFPNSDRATFADAVALTPAYAAPELLLGDGAVDGRADLYSLGVMLFEMLAGCCPFQGADRAELLQAHRRQPPPDIAARRPDVPPAIAAVVRQLLSKHPVRRPPTASAAAEELVRLEVSLLRGG